MKRVAATACIVAALGALAWWSAGAGSRDDAAQRDGVSPAGGADAASGAGSAAAAGAATEPVGTAAPRTRLAAVVLAGRVLDATGAPLAGATLRWSPLPLAARAHDVDRAQLERSTRIATSDADGAFEFDAAPPWLGEAHASSVVWASHPTHLAAYAPVDRGSVGHALRTPFRLAPAPPVTALVRTPGGAPVAGARVEQFLDGTDAALAFTRSARTDAEGRAVLHPWPGAGGSLAEHAGARSAVRFGEAPTDGEPVELVLRPTFTLRGRVERAAGAPAPSALRVYPGFHDGGAIDWLASLPVRADGTFGPVARPLLDGATLFVECTGADAIGKKRELPRPAPGEAVEFLFHAEPGASLAVRIVDGESGAPVGGAWVRANWDAVGDDAAFADERTDTDGATELRGVRPGDVWITATADGFADPGWRGPYRVEPTTAESSREPIELTLSAPAALVGRVVHGGQPVRSFQVVHWTGEHDVTRERFDDEDGRFELPRLAANAGTMHVLAYADGLSQSRPRAVTLDARAPVEVELELPAPLTGHGRVVDARTGAALSDATVQVHAADGLQPLFPMGAALPVDPDGRFELAGLSPGATAIGVFARGYAAYFDGRRAEGGERVDFGTIALEATCRATVRVEAGVDPTALALDGEVGNPFDGARFDARGELVLEELRPQWTRFVLRTPDGARIAQERELHPGGEHELVFRLDGRATLVVTLEDADSGATVEASWAELAGQPTRARVILDAEGSARIAGIAPGEVALEARAPSGGVLAARVVRAAPGEQRVTLTPGDGRGALRLRVEDPSGRPLAGAAVDVRGADGGPWEASGTTDAAGRFALDAVPYGELVCGLSHVDAGRAYGYFVRASNPGEELLVLDGRGRLELLVVDRDVPLPALRVDLYDEAALRQRQRSFTDAAGAVAFAPLGPGAYRIAIEQVGHWPVEELVELAAGGGTRAVQVRRLGDLELSVVTAEGALVPGVEVELTSAEFGTPVQTWVEQGRIGAPTGLVSDQDGRVRVRGLPNGAYIWKANSGGEEREGTLTVAPGEVSAGVAVLGEP